MKNSYSFYEVRIVFARCKTLQELNKACAGFLAIIEDGDLSPKLDKYARHQSRVRLRQLKV